MNFLRSDCFFSDLKVFFSFFVMKQPMHLASNLYLQMSMHGLGIFIQLKNQKSYIGPIFRIVNLEGIFSRWVMPLLLIIQLEILCQRLS